MKEGRDPDGNQGTLTSSCLGSEEGEAETRFPYKFLLLKVAQEPSSAGEGGWVCLLLSAFPPFPASALQPDRTEERWRGGGEGEESQPPKEKTQLRAVTLRHGRREGALGLREKKKKEEKGFRLVQPFCGNRSRQRTRWIFFFFPSSAFLFQRKDFHSGKKTQTTKRQNKTSETEHEKKQD